MLQVYHSQKLKEKPLKPWVIAQHDGKVISAHCDCMAGLGEACTHVAALLFWIEVRVNMRNSQTVTGEKAYWMVPTSAPGDNAMLPLRDIDFTSAKNKKIILDSAISSIQECPSPSHRTSRKLHPPTKDELHNLFSTLSTCPQKAAILAVLPGFSHKFKPRSLCKDFPDVWTKFISTMQNAVDSG